MVMDKKGVTAIMANKLLQTIFSVTNSSNTGHKVITILGAKIKIKIKLLKSIFSITNSQNAKHKIITILDIKIKIGYGKWLLKKIYRELPKTMTVAETVDKIINEKCSIARFGDGEYLIISGEGIWEYQEYDEELAAKLKKIIKNNSPKCLVGIVSPIHAKMAAIDYWETFLITKYKFLKKYLNFKSVYANSAISRISVFLECPVPKIKQMWEGQNLLCVVGSGSRYFYDDRLFNNVDKMDMLVVKGRDSYQNYQKIFEQIQQYGKDKLILISLGPTATVLAYELSELGYHVLDIGHLPNCYAEYLKEKGQPEQEKPLGYDLAEGFVLQEGFYPDIKNNSELFEILKSSK